jgi:cytochrome c
MSRIGACRLLVGTTAAAIWATITLCHASTFVNERGRRLFEPCRACHALDPASPPMPGPNLFRLIGRKLAGDPKFDYSPVLRAARASGRAWDRRLLDRFLRDPEGMFPGMWMTSRPISNAAERKALVDFLADPNSR